MRSVTWGSKCLTFLFSFSGMIEIIIELWVLQPQTWTALLLVLTLP